MLWYESSANHYNYQYQIGDNILMACLSMEQITKIAHQSHSCTPDRAVTRFSYSDDLPKKNSENIRLNNI